MARRATPIIAAAAASAAIVGVILVMHGAHKSKSKQTLREESATSSKSGPGAGAVVEEREHRPIRDDDAAEMSATREDVDAMAIGSSVGGGHVEQLGNDDVEKEAAAQGKLEDELEVAPADIAFPRSFDGPIAGTMDENADETLNTSFSQEPFEAPAHLDFESISIEQKEEFDPVAENEAKNAVIVMNIDATAANENEEETEFPVLFLTSSIHEESKMDESCAPPKASDGEGVFSSEVELNSTSTLIASNKITGATVVEDMDNGSHEALAVIFSSNNCNINGVSKLEEATTRLDNSSNKSISSKQIDVIPVDFNDSTLSNKETISEVIKSKFNYAPAFCANTESNVPILNASRPTDKLQEPHDDNKKEEEEEETREGQHCPTRGLQKEHRQHSSSTLASATSSEAHHHHHHFHVSVSKLVPHSFHLKEHLRHSFRVFKHDADDGSSSHDGSVSSSTTKNRMQNSIKKKKGSKRELHLGSLLVKSASLYSVSPDLCPKASQHAIHF
ncbi:hypothetical protein ACHAXS_011199 [Conticribra weissflogii]